MQRRRLRREPEHGLQVSGQREQGKRRCKLEERSPLRGLSVGCGVHTQCGQGRNGTPSGLREGKGNVEARVKVGGGGGSRVNEQARRVRAAGPEYE